MLCDLDYVMEHRHCTSMRHVDVLSRNPIYIKIEENLTHKNVQAQETNDEIKLIKEILQVK